MCDHDITAHNNSTHADLYVVKTKHYNEGRSGRLVKDL